MALGYTNLFIIIIISVPPSQSLGLWFLMILTLEHFHYTNGSCAPCGDQWPTQRPHVSTPGASTEPTTGQAGTEQCTMHSYT